jgi:hypothetical protein
MTPWLRIVKDARFTYGPTIPYILGALRHPIGKVEPPEVSKRELRALLEAMLEEITPPECVVIQPCDAIGTYVASARPLQPEGRHFIRSTKHADHVLCHAVDGKNHDLDSLAAALWKIHQDEICEGNFSRVPDLLIPREYKWASLRDDSREQAAIRATLAGNGEMERVQRETR